VGRARRGAWGFESHGGRGCDLFGGGGSGIWRRDSTIRVAQFPGRLGELFGVCAGDGGDGLRDG